ncbi:MAG: hypothetical protein V3S51_07265 [Dehalococcoidia bacterium]
MPKTEKVELRCPVCDSGHVYTRKSDRRCVRCGHEGGKESFEHSVRSDHGAQKTD